MEEKQFTIDKTHLTREYREKLENERRMREYTDNVEKILDSHHSEMIPTLKSRLMRSQRKLI